MRGAVLTRRLRVRIPPGWIFRGEPGAHPRLLTVLRGFESLPLSQVRPRVDQRRDHTADNRETKVRVLPCGPFRRVAKLDCNWFTPSPNGSSNLPPPTSSGCAALGEPRRSRHPLTVEIAGSSPARGTSCCDAVQVVGEPALTFNQVFAGSIPVGVTIIGKWAKG